MTTALIGALRVTLGLDTAAFEKGAAKAKAESAGLEAAIKNRVSAISGAMKGLSALAAGSAIGVAIREGLEYASSLGEVAQQLGVTTRTLQEYRYVVGQVGVDQESLDNGLSKLTLSIGKAEEGSKKQVAAFAALGVSIRDANGQVKTTDELLPELIAKFSAMEDPAKRAALEVALFGKSGQKLDTLLAGGVDQVDNLRNAAARLGIVLSDRQIQQADDTADKLASLQTVLKANIAGAVADNAGAIVDLANSLQDLVAQASRVPAAMRAAGNWLGRAEGWGNIFAGMATSRTDQITLGQDLLDRYADRPASAAGSAQAWLDGWRAKQPRARKSMPTGGGGGGGGGGRARSRGGGRARTGGAAKSPQDELAQILDGLLPDDAERRKLKTDLGKLRGALARGGLDKDTFDRAVAAAESRLDRSSRLTGPGLLADNDDVDLLPVPKFKVQVEDTTGLLNDVKVANDGLRDSFVELARDAAGSLQNLASSIRGGGLLDIIGSLLDAILRLGSAGVFGGKVAGGLRSGIAGARAMGGPVEGGRTYLVGERGPELFTAPGAGTIVPNHALGGGRPIVFDARGAVVTSELLGQFQAIAAQTSGQLITANNATLMKRSRQRLGR